MNLLNFLRPYTRKIGRTLSILLVAFFCSGISDCAERLNTNQLEPQFTAWEKFDMGDEAKRLNAAMIAARTAGVSNNVDTWLFWSYEARKWQYIRDWGTPEESRRVKSGGPPRRPRIPLTATEKKQYTTYLGINTEPAPTAADKVKQTQARDASIIRKNAVGAQNAATKKSAIQAPDTTLQKCADPTDEDCD